MSQSSRRTIVVPIVPARSTTALAFAVLIAVAALALRLAVGALLGNVIPFPTFYLGTIIVTIVGGAEAGALAALLGAALVEWFLPSAIGVTTIRFPAKPRRYTSRHWRAKSAFGFSLERSLASNARSKFAEPHQHDDRNQSGEDRVGVKASKTVTEIEVRQSGFDRFVPRQRCNQAECRRG
jgi:hypothetical protein